MQLPATDANEVFEHFGVSPHIGFLQATADRLPEAYAPWEELAGSLTSLLAVGAIRSAVGRLPVLDTAGLRGDPKLLARARMLLTTTGQAWVFGEEPTGQVLPAALAVPLCEVSAALDLPPIMAYIDYVLGNWALIDPDRPLSFDNLRVRISISHGVDEAWFILTHVVVEAEAGTALASCVEASLAARAGKTDALTGALRRLAHGITRIEKTFRRVRERCDPYVYFLRVRPYTHGWENNEAFARGMVYEDAPGFAGEPMRFRGETGAQSSVIPAIDETLGIEHPVDGLSAHRRAMRAYMPPAHRAFLDWLGESGLRGFVESSAARGEAGARLLEAYNACCETLGRFRTTHLQIARDYVFAYRATDLDSPANSASVGTGGTPAHYLEGHRDATRASVIDRLS